MQPWSIDEALAVSALRQWRYQRGQIRRGKIGGRFQNPGRPTIKANATRYDAAIVGVLDFEKILEQLSTQEQQMLTLTYADGQGQTLVAAVLKISVRALNYKLSNARRKLAIALDRADLL